MWFDSFIESANKFLNEVYEELETAYKSGVEGIGNTLYGTVDWVWGTLLGNWNPNQTTSQIVADAALGLVPILNIILDIRDLIACIYAFYDEENENSEQEKWIMLILILSGFIPFLGDSIKAMGRIVMINIRRYGSQNIEKAVQSSLEPIVEFLQDEKVIRIISTNQINKILKDIADQFREQARQLNSSKITNFWREVNLKIRGWLDYPLPEDIKQFLQKTLLLSENLLGKSPQPLAAGIGEVKVILLKTADELEQSGLKVQQNVKFNRKEDITTSRHSPNVTRAERRTIRCFQPSNSLLKKAKSEGKDIHKFEKEYYRQLKDQQNGINQLSAKEYLDGRDIYEKYGRIGGQAQQQARENYQKKIEKSLEGSYRKSGLSLNEAEIQAKNESKKIMQQLDALHSPDMIAGGKDKVMRLGDASINRSIGSQWRKNGRLDEMDDYAKEMMAKYGEHAKMNVELNRCK
ncbi:MULTISPECIES: polymorphic toxin type 15 domain-containing protein [unclassified Pasteurella]|uniref:polymorphic toxin type 15 domain-containing protein n=1 Tax=unclassified Pasteurella TaxID=2621516 RepID=UPI0010738E42|nr:hypothetical protein [Pasteurella sp. 19428wF3_WM03]TFU49455.1 hypothetical protein E4T92_10850 [Pasteurella sp. WM03]